MDTEAVSQLEDRIKEMERSYAEMNPQDPGRASLKEEIVREIHHLRQMKSQINMECAAKGEAPVYYNVYDRMKAEEADDDPNVDVCFRDDPDDGGDSCSVM